MAEGSSWRNRRRGAGATLCAVAGWLVVLSLAWAQEIVLEVIPLRYRTVEQVLPVIRPMLAGGGTASGLQGKLVVRTTPANMEEVRRILLDIDTPPRRLLISVRQDSQADYAARQAEVSGSIGTDRGRIRAQDGSGRHDAGAEARAGDSRLRARVLDSGAAASDRYSQTVQATEGSPAYIRVGESVPVPQGGVVGTYGRAPYGEAVVGATEYRDVTSGFYAVARVAGDRVTLEISPRREALSSQIQGGVNVQQVVTTVSGRLGEWIEVAGLTQSADAGQSVLLGRTGARASDTRRVLVKVEELKSP
jgi:hypothetical protein